MQDMTRTTSVKNRWRLFGWGAAAGLLALPLVAMQFTREVNWDGFDFLVAAILIGGVGLGLELAVRATRNSGYRVAAALALLTGFLVTWSNLAVGIIGDEDHPANLMFFAVVALAILGSVAAMGRARVLGRVMAFAGVGQFVVPGIAFLIWSPAVDANLGRVLVFNGVFAAMWLTSAWLFGRAAQDSSGS